MSFYLFAEFRLPSAVEGDETTIAPLVSANWCYTAVAIDRQLHLSGAVYGHLSGHSASLQFTKRIRQLATNDRCCLVLLESGQLHRVCPVSGAVAELNFIETGEKETTESPAVCLPARRKRIFPDDNDDGVEHVDATPANSSSIRINPTRADRDRIVDIACTHTFSVALSAHNRLYCIPSEVHRFRRAERIVKLCAGAEHVLLLSVNGDVFVFGSSL